MRRSGVQFLYPAPSPDWFVRLLRLLIHHEHTSQSIIRIDLADLDIARTNAGGFLSRGGDRCDLRGRFVVRSADTAAQRTRNAGRCPIRSQAPRTPPKGCGGLLGSYAETS